MEAVKCNRAALTLAVREGYVKIVELLIKTGANVDAKDSVCLVVFVMNTSFIVFEDYLKAVWHLLKSNFLQCLSIFDSEQ